MTEEIVRAFFARFGPVDRVLMALDAKTGLFRGFCYVIMRNQQDFDSLLSSGDKLTFFGHQLCLTSAMTTEQITTQRKLAQVEVAKNHHGHRSSGYES